MRAFGSRYRSLGEPGPPRPELANEWACGPHLPDHNPERPFCGGEGPDPSHNALLSEGPPGAAVRRGQLCKGKQREGSDSVVVSEAWWNQWRHSRFQAWLDGGVLVQACQAGNAGREDVTLPEICQLQGGGGGTGRCCACHSLPTEKAGLPWAGVTARMKFRSAVPGDSRLPVLLKPSASHIWEASLNMDRLDGLWLGLMSSSVRSISLPDPSIGPARIALTVHMPLAAAQAGSEAMRLRFRSVRGSRLLTSFPDPTSRLSACEREILSDH